MKLDCQSIVIGGASSQRYYRAARATSVATIPELDSGEMCQILVAVSEVTNETDAER